MNNTTQHKIDLDVEFGGLNTVMDWCRDNCQGTWHITDKNTHMTHQTPLYNRFVNNYQFEFVDQRDVVTFNLKFK